jgi:hypothetical protein
VPEELVRFVQAEWPGLDVWAAFDAWKAARHAWHDAHVPEGGSGPWGGEYGDSIDMIRGERETRRRLHGFTG